MWRHCEDCQVYWKENSVVCWCCGTPTPINRGPGITANRYVDDATPVDPLDERYYALAPRVLA